MMAAQVVANMDLMHLARRRPAQGLGALRLGTGAPTPDQVRQGETLQGLSRPLVIRRSGPDRQGRGRLPAGGILAAQKGLRRAAAWYEELGAFAKPNSGARITFLQPACLLREGP